MYLTDLMDMICLNYTVCLNCLICLFYRASRICRIYLTGPAVLIDLTGLTFLTSPTHLSYPAYVA